MDYNELVREVVARVLAEMELPQRDSANSGKQRFFVVTPEHGQLSRSFLESPDMKARFNMICAMSKDYSCDLECSAGLGIFGLSNSDLARLEGGICDTPFTALISKALLMGLPTYAVSEEIEIIPWGYKTTYASLFSDKLKILEGCGLRICAYDQLEKIILGGEKHLAGSGNGAYICRGKLITERDVTSARDAGARTIKTIEKSIITDLARESAKRHGIEFLAR